VAALNSMFIQPPSESLQQMLGKYCTVKSNELRVRRLFRVRNTQIAYEILVAMCEGRRLLRRARRRRENNLKTI
jgi:hypothetical protein